MTDYNFAKNYENIKSWEFKKQDSLKPSPENFLEELTNFIKNYPKLFLFLKKEKIIYLPTLFVLTGVSIIEIISIFPILNIQRLESTHFEYEDKVNALSEINRTREEKFKNLKEYSSLLSNPSPSYLFGYYLQESIPNNVQLIYYIVDNSGFILSANSNNLVSANKFISLLLDNKLVNNDSIEIKRIINQVNNEDSSEQQINIADSISIEISGKLNHFSLIDRIKSYKESEDNGNLKKLSDYFQLLELIR